jgi:hypothetical protein
LFDAAVQFAAAPMLLKEGVEIANQGPHGPQY